MKTGHMLGLIACVVVASLAFAIGDRRMRVNDQIDPGRPPRWPGPYQLEWLGHSGFLLTWHGLRLVVDPNLNDHCTLVPRLRPAPLRVDQLGTVDAVLITHAHADHLDRSTLDAIVSRSWIIPLGCRTYLAGHEPLSELGEEQSVDVGQLQITAVHAQHNGSRFHPFSSQAKALGYLVSDGQHSIYFAGDTGWGDHFAAIRDHYHPELAVLPIGAYSPAFPIGRYHLSPTQAVKAAQTLEVSMVVPCHFGTFRLAFDDPSYALPRFLDFATENHLAVGIAPDAKPWFEKKSHPEVGS